MPSSTPGEVNICALLNHTASLRLVYCIFLSCCTLTGSLLLTLCMDVLHDACNVSLLKRKYYVHVCMQSVKLCEQYVPFRVWVPRPRSCGSAQGAARLYRGGAHVGKSESLTLHIYVCSWSVFLLCVVIDYYDLFWNGSCMIQSDDYVNTTSYSQIAGSKATLSSIEGAVMCF